MGKKHQKHLPEKATPIEGAELARRDAGLPATRTALARVTHEDLSRADKIHIDGLEVFANHGVYPEERALGQKFVVSLTLYTSLREAGRTDDLRASIDYGKVCHDVDAFLREHVFKLIEAAAEGLADDLLARYGALLGVRVRLEKPWAPVGLPLRTVAVEIERTR
ncbi:dihydroneopterin aldolase [Collinsella tanakaei]|uniref:dihydroneopterin aldolase n=1 Tax=Collinsella tanakaei TaxID=626935 RepID=UPI00195C297E|nr:dihydroneopterin aldolase [Collinsella tanakaei]MBM6868320.1 dihydroneopterin aldolase [Collinsella tanakaei]